MVWKSPACNLLPTLKNNGCAQAALSHIPSAKVGGLREIRPNESCVTSAPAPNYEYFLFYKYTSREIGYEAHSIVDVLIMRLRALYIL